MNKQQFPYVGHGDGREEESAAKCWYVTTFSTPCVVLLVVLNNLDRTLNNQSSCSLTRSKLVLTNIP